MKPKTTELIAIKELKPHPRNYRSHPEDQLVHLVNSIKQHGFYRNVVVAKDNTILAGHGVVPSFKLCINLSCSSFRLAACVAASP
jgi:hypothetical protein